MTKSIYNTVFIWVACVLLMSLLWSCNGATNTKPPAEDVNDSATSDSDHIQNVLNISAVWKGFYWMTSISSDLCINSVEDSPRTQKLYKYAKQEWLKKNNPDLKKLIKFETNLLKRTKSLEMQKSLSKIAVEGSGMTREIAKKNFQSYPDEMKPAFCTALFLKMTDSNVTSQIKEKHPDIYSKAKMIWE